MALNDPDYFTVHVLSSISFLQKKKIALTPSSDSREILYQLICGQNPLPQLKKIVRNYTLQLQFKKSPDTEQHPNILRNPPHLTVCRILPASKETRTHYFSVTWATSLLWLTKSTDIEVVIDVI